MNFLDVVRKTVKLLKPYINFTLNMDLDKGTVILVIAL